MKKILIIFYLVLLSSCLSSQEIVLEMLVDTDDANTPLGYSTKLSEYIPYTEEGNVIYRLDSIGKHPVHTIDNRYYIFHIDYNPDNNKILYTFGISGMTYPAIYDLNESKEILLRNVAKDGHDTYFYSMFGDAYWLDDTSIIYVVVDPETYRDEIKTFNLSNNESIVLTEGEDIIIYHFNKEEKILVFKTLWDDVEGLNIFNIETKEYTLSDERKYGYIIAISDEKYIGFSKEDYPCIVTFVKNGEVVYTDSQYDSISPVFYDSESGILIAQMHIKDKNTGREDTKFGVFQIRF